MNFKISHVDHIGIAVKDLAESKVLYRGTWFKSSWRR